MGEVRISDEMLKAATKAIIIQMQCYDFGHLRDDGDFVTTAVKIELLEARAKEAAKAALSAALSGMAQPVAYQQFKDGKWVECSHFVAFGWGTEIDKDCRPLFTAPPASDLREENGWQPIKTAPKDGTEILGWFPCLKLDEDGDLTNQPVDEEPFGGRAIVSWEGNGWREPDWLNASGDWFGDDYEYAPDPTLWQPLPAPPIQTEGK